MTIPEAAKLYGVKPQAVYNRINRAKMKDPSFNLESLMQPGTSSLSEAGEAQLAEWFKQTRVSKSSERLIQLERECIELSKRINEAEQSLKVKTEECEELNKRCNQLEQDTAALREQIHVTTEERDFLRLTLSQTIETHRATIAALQPSAKEPGLLARIRARFTAKKEG